MEPIKFSTNIEKPSSLMCNDAAYKVNKVYINWSMEVVKTTSCANIRIYVESVYVYATKGNLPIQLTYKDADSIKISMVHNYSIKDDIRPWEAYIDINRKEVTIIF
jgi:hypothetical protein